MDRVLRRAMVRRLEPAFAQAARELLEPLLARGGGDYAQEFALPYAATAPIGGSRVPPQLPRRRARPG